MTDRMTRARRRVGRICGIVAIAVLSAASGSASAAPLHPEAVECDSVRRLSDNFLLDLRIRMVFDYPTRRYIRLENTGRGWERIAGVHHFQRAGNTRLNLETNEFVTSYLEPLTGYYYYIDRSGVTPSVWAHCAKVEGISPLF